MLAASSIAAETPAGWLIRLGTSLFYERQMTIG
jgi:hypothetical protein